ncbi:MAG: sigma-70 family RNA polymerase sigma factor [Thermoguttaceae bacterium]|nr:sigma-70 family RNA polymerase sigma factor [Thermoguttaceae bacterium]
MREDYSDITNEQIERFVPFLNGHLRRKYAPHPDPDELYSAGLEGIAEGIRRYDPGKGVPYAYWVQRYAAHYVQNRASALRREAAPADAPLDGIPDPAADDPLDLLAAREQVRTAMAALDGDERRVVSAIYLRGLSMRAAARSLKISTDMVFRTHRRALEKMRAALGVENV